MKTLLIILVLAYSVFPCAPAQPIYGTAPQGSTITLEFYYSIPVSPFGYYEFEPVLPCSNYQVTMRHKSLPTESVIVTPDDFNGKGAEVNF